MMVISSGIFTSVYFLAFLYIVMKTTDSYNPLNLIESVLNLLGALSDTPLAFIFALLMNFVIILAIYAINWCSLCMAELSKMVEWRRTGGRGKREIEMNNFK